MSEFIMKELMVDDRPYEKLMAKGAEQLSDAELLAIIIKTGTGGINATDLARRLLADKKIGGGLEGIHRAGIHQLMEHKGIGKVKAVQLKACMELANRLKICDVSTKPMATPDVIAQHMMHKAKGLKKEVCWILCFDTRMNLINESMISIGTLDMSIVHPRDIFVEVIKACAHSFVIVHNHPSGDVTPSQNDIVITNRLKKSGMLLGMHLRDHIIISGQNYFSFLTESML